MFLDLRDKSSDSACRDVAYARNTSALKADVIYTQCRTCSYPIPRFIPSPYLLSPRFIPQSVFYALSVVRSPQSVLYIDRV